MPVEGPLPSGHDAFGLIETFKWSPTAGYDHLDQHLARLRSSAVLLGFAYRREAVEGALTAFAAELGDAPARVRLVLSSSGSAEVAATPLGCPATAYRVAVAGTRHSSGDPWLRHKTTRRDRYERPLAAAVATGADEVLFLNERDELCEGARCNVFVRRGAMLLTPPLACGVLPGTLRASLIATGGAQEALLGLPDLDAAPAWFMGNSVRGLVPATLALPVSGIRPLPVTP